MKKIPIIIILVILVILVGVVYADLTGTEGLAIDLSSAGAGTDFTIAFDPTELFGNRTWGDASTDTIVWTFNRATGTDPTFTFNSGSIALPALTLTTDLAVAEGGTGVSTFTDGGPLLGSGAGAITAMSVLGDGEIIIGDGTTDPVALDVGSSTAITILGTVATGVWQGTAIADGYVPDTITIDLATVATTVTITDNEDTAENNPIVFVAGADPNGGNLGLESDGTTHYNPSTGTITATEFVGGGAGLTSIDAATGDSATDFFDAGEIVDARISDTLTSSTCTGTSAVATGVTCTDNDTEALACPIVFVDGATGTQGAETDANDFTYNPSTGTITATEFSGGGASLTAIDAATGDSATAFFDAGTIEHEYGGVEADISSYDGLVGIKDGSTIDVNSSAEMLAAIDDETGTGALVFGTSPTFTTGITVPNDSISDEELDEGGTFTWTGIHDFTSVTTTVPWKVNATAAPTVEGQAIWESDTDELTVGDGSVSVVIAAKTNTVFCFNIHDIDSGMDDIKMPFTRATTITKVTVFVTAGTNVVGRLYEVDGDGDDADAVGVEEADWTFTTGETEDSSFFNATFDAGDYIQWDTTSVSGSVTGFMISVEGYEI